jgi:hypothetical protein
MNSAEYICHRYAGGKLTMRPEQSNYAEYVYWMHFNNNILGLFFAALRFDLARVTKKLPASCRWYSRSRRLPVLGDAHRRADGLLSH